MSTGSLPQTSLTRQIEDKSRYSPFIWTISRTVPPSRDKKWDFTDRKWQIPIFDDMHPRIVSKKSAQVGETTIFICKALWFMDYRSVNVIWTFPRQDDVSEFVQTRFYPLLTDSPALSKHVGRGQEDPKSLRITKFRDSYIYFQEASVEPRMTPADLLANDEVDRSRPDFLDAFVGRLEDSPYKIHYRFSTPTIPGFGIDAIFQNESDQRYWMVKCPHCNHFQSLKWDVNFMISPDNTPYYGCEKCSGVLPPDCIINGEFVPMKEGRNVHGYHVSGMMMPISKPPSYMLDRSKNMDTKNFYNILLGETYQSAVLRFDRESILAEVYDTREEPYDHAPSAKGGTYMGVDQKGKGDLHIVIAQDTPNNATGVNVMRIIHVELIKQRPGKDSWTRLSEIMRNFNIRFAVHDAMPNQHNAQAFRDMYPGRVALKYDAPISARELYNYDDKKGKLILARTMNFDGLLDDIYNGLWRFWGTQRPLPEALSELLGHCSNLKRDEEEHRGKDGSVSSVGVWRKTGPDDFAHAWAYCRVAKLIRPSNQLQTTLIGAAAEEEERQESVSYKESKVWPGLMIPVKKKSGGPRLG